MVMVMAVVVVLVVVLAVVLVLVLVVVVVVVEVVVLVLIVLVMSRSNSSFQGREYPKNFKTTAWLEWSLRQPAEAFAKGGKCENGDASAASYKQYLKIYKHSAFMRKEYLGRSAAYGNWATMLGKLSTLTWFLWNFLRRILPKAHPPPTAARAEDEGDEDEDA
jgi:Mn2+/Fe2+ NRAMP family transporter